MRGFTIIELFMVLAIMGIIAVSVSPMFKEVTEEADAWEESYVDCDEPTIENEGGLFCDRP